MADYSKPLATTGIYMPTDWGSIWRAKRDAAGSAKAVVAGVGTSIMQGFWASNLKTKSFMSLVAADLHTAYGDGGSGFVGTCRTVAGSSSMSSYVANTGLVAATGTWSLGAEGPGMVTCSTTNVGDTLTFVVNGTTAKIYYVKSIVGANTGGRWTYTVDGGGAVTVNGWAASSGYGQIALTGLSAGDHTIVITFTGATGSCIIIGCNGENATGVVVNNFGRGGSRASGWVATPTLVTGSSITAWNGGAQYPCDVLIYEPAVNDATDGTAADTYAANVRKFLDGTKSISGTLGAMDLIFLMPHVVAYDNVTTPVYHLYCERMRGLAETYGAAFINIWGMYRNNATYWGTTLGAGSDGTNGGGTGTDVHPHDTGHQLIANALLSVLKS